MEFVAKQKFNKRKMYFYTDKLSGGTVSAQDTKVCGSKTAKVDFFYYSGYEITLDFH